MRVDSCLSLRINIVLLFRQLLLQPLVEGRIYDLDCVRSGKLNGCCVTDSLCAEKKSNRRGGPATIAVIEYKRRDLLDGLQRRVPGGHGRRHLAAGPSRFLGCYTSALVESQT